MGTQSTWATRHASRHTHHELLHSPTTKSFPEASFPACERDYSNDDGSLQCQLHRFRKGVAVMSPASRNDDGGHDLHQHRYQRMGTSPLGTSPQHRSNGVGTSPKSSMPEDMLHDAIEAVGTSPEMRRMLKQVESTLHATI